MVWLCGCGMRKPVGADSRDGRPSCTGARHAATTQSRRRRAPRARAIARSSRKRPPTPTPRAAHRRIALGAKRSHRDAESIAQRTRTDATGSTARATDPGGSRGSQTEVRAAPRPHRHAPTAPAPTAPPPPRRGWRTCAAPLLQEPPPAADGRPGPVARRAAIIVGTPRGPPSGPTAPHRLHRGAACAASPPRQPPSMHFGCRRRRRGRRRPGSAHPQAGGRAGTRRGSDCIR